jgi:hypothetical protein
MATPEATGSTPQGGASAPNNANSASTPSEGSRAPQSQPNGESASAAAARAWASDQRFAGDQDGSKVWEAYRNAESQLGQMGQYKTAAEQWTNFANQFGGAQNVAQLLQLGLQAWQQQQQAQGGAAQGGAPAQQGADPFKQWDSLTPHQQASLMRDVVQAQVQSWGQQYAQQIAQQLQGQMGGMQRQWEIFNLAMQKKAEDPTFNVEQGLAEMLRLANSTPAQLMSLAVNNLGFDQKVKQAAEALAAQRIADNELKYKNQQLASLTKMLPGPQSAVTRPSISTVEGKRSILQDMIDRGIIGPENI